MNKLGKVLEVILIVLTILLAIRIVIPNKIVLDFVNGKYNYSRMGKYSK